MKHNNNSLKKKTANVLCFLGFLFLFLISLYVLMFIDVFQCLFVVFLNYKGINNFFAKHRKKIAKKTIILDDRMEIDTLTERF